MKVRNGFVTNSSSSSGILSVKGDGHSSAKELISKEIKKRIYDHDGSVVGDFLAEVLYNNVTEERQYCEGNGGRVITNPSDFLIQFSEWDYKISYKYLAERLSNYSWKEIPIDLSDKLEGLCNSVYYFWDAHPLPDDESIEEYMEFANDVNKVEELCHQIIDEFHPTPFKEQSDYDRTRFYDISFESPFKYNPDMLEALTNVCNDGAAVYFNVDNCDEELQSLCQALGVGLDG